jgi:hypothetical protein
MDIQCQHCESYLNIREVVTRCTECKELLKTKTNNMKATLDNFLVKWDGNNPLWKELIEWLNKDTNNNLFSGDVESRYYGRIEGETRAPESYRLIDELINTPIISLEDWKQLINKTNNMNPFKEKDTVYHYKYGEGKVIEVQNDTVLVQYEDKSYWHSELTLLSFAPYKLEGFTQERPFTLEVGEYYYFWDVETIMNDAVGYGRLKQISNNINFPYFFGTKYFQFCSDKNPLL